MKVILISDVKGLGKKDDIVEVNSGYGNNFLLNKGLAILADNTNLAKLKSAKAKEAELKAEELAEAKNIEKEIVSKDYKVQVKIGANGKMIGSVTSSEIADVIEKVSDSETYKYKAVTLRSINDQGNLDEEQCDDFISKDKLTDRYLTIKNDILIRLFSPLKTSLINDSQENIVVPSQFGIIRINKNFQRDIYRQNQPKLVYYYNNQRILIGGIITKDVNTLVQAIAEADRLSMSAQRNCCGIIS